MHENTPRPGCPWCHAPECSPTCPGPPGVTYEAPDHEAGPAILAMRYGTTPAPDCTAPTAYHLDGGEVCTAGHHHYTGRHHGPHRQEHR